MSESFDRSRRPRPSPPDASSPYYEELDPRYDRDYDFVEPPPEPKTGRRPAQDELIAPARQQKAVKVREGDSIVPPSTVTGSSLTLVVTIMCFLACLTAGAVYMINQSAAAWMREIASEVSVQVEARANLDLDKRVAEIAAFLGRQTGVRKVTALSQAESNELLEPWLGRTEAIATLPVPRLLALELDRNGPPDLDKLRQALSRQFPGATLDDHRHWQAQIRTVTRSFGLGGLAILLLVGAATTAIIISATRSAMASNREIVEVLHFVGATDRFIAREFERHFLRLGVRAGLVGAFSAMAVFALMPGIMRLLGGGAVTTAELSRFVGSGSLDLPGFFLLGIVVVVIAALCMLTSRMGVYRILNTQI
jgi:cell division transport system permease protein